MCTPNTDPSNNKNKNNDFNHFAKVFLPQKSQKQQQWFWSFAKKKKNSPQKSFSTWFSNMLWFSEALEN